MAGTGSRTALALFRPQAWIGDQAIDVDGEYRFDIAAQLDEMGADAALAIEDGTYESDALWRHNPIRETCDWNGPFEVEAAAVIAEYFAEK